MTSCSQRARPLSRESIQSRSHSTAKVSKKRLLHQESIKQNSSRSSVTCSTRSLIKMSHRNRTKSSTSSVGLQEKQKRLPSMRLLKSQDLRVLCFSRLALLHRQVQRFRRKAHKWNISNTSTLLSRLK